MIAVNYLYITTAKAHSHKSKTIPLLHFVLSIIVGGIVDFVCAIL